MRMLTLCTSLMFLLASISLPGISSAVDTQENSWKIATGRNPMPRWQDKLSAEQIWFTVNFIQNPQPAAD